MNIFSIFNLKLLYVRCMENEKADEENTYLTSNFSFNVTSINTHNRVNSSSDSREKNFEFILGGIIVLGIVWLLLIFYLILVINLFRDYRSWFKKEEENEVYEVYELETSL